MSVLYSKPSCFLLILLFYIAPVYSQTCNNWLSLPAYQSYVSVGDLDVPGDKITVEAVFMRTAPYSGGEAWAGDLVSKHNNPPDINYLLRPGTAEITTSNNGYVKTPDICPIELNKIYHVAMVYDGASLKFYRNGFLMSSVAASGTLFQNNFNTRIGLYDAIVHNTQLIGYINEVRIWNVARTQAQIKTYMNTSLPNPATQTGLQAYYTFDNLLNKQGNPAWNGTLGGSAQINQTSGTCTFVADSCSTAKPVTAGFLAPDTVCLNEPVNITNMASNATNYFWNFCAGNSYSAPTGVNLGNIGNALGSPVFSDIVSDNGNYYLFVSNHLPGGLVRLDFGNSLLNTPTAVPLGTVGGVIINTIEGLQVVKNEGKWYVIMVGGHTLLGITSRIIKVELGANITNTNPVGTDWGNLGNLAYPVDLHMFQEGNRWYGLTLNAQNRTLTRFDFSASFDNIPIGQNLGNPGGSFTYPTGIFAINDNNNWHVFVVNDEPDADLIRLDFGNSLLNTPVLVNLGNPGNVLNKTRDICFLKECGNITAFAVNGETYDQFIRLDFGSDLLSTPTGTNLGNIGNLSLPHSLSKIFRVESDLYTFITNVSNNSLTRIRFSGCTNSSIPNSSLPQPPPVVYTTPGIYTITQTLDIGLPTQTSTCRQVVVVDNAHLPVKNLNVCAGDSIKVGSSSIIGTYLWSNGVSADSIFISTPGYHWVETKRSACINRDSFFVTITPLPNVALGNDTLICSSSNLLLNAGNPGSTYAWNTGAASQTLNVSNAGEYSVTVISNGCSKADTINITVEKPVVTTNADTVICAGKPVQFQASGAQDYSWLPDIALSDGAVSNPVANPITSTEYIVTGTTVNGCTAKDTVQVNVFDKPSIGIQADTAICKNTSLPLWVNGGVSYAWSSSPTLNNPSSASPIVSPVTSTSYQVVITDVNTCEHLDSVRVDILPDPVFTVNSPVQTCINDSIVLTASGGDTYLWLPVDGLNNPAIAEPKVSPAVTTDYEVTITETTCGNSTTLQTRVTVLPLPVISAASSNDLDCSYDRSRLDATGARTYSWTPSATLNNASVHNPVAMPKATTTYVVAGTDRSGCTGYDSITVKVDNSNKGGYLMPSAFTPNNDGLNDCYGIKFWGIVDNIEFSVFDRWGVRVFYSKERDACWDGTYKGEKQSAGVYVYMIKASTNCENPVFRKGTFVLVR